MPKTAMNAACLWPLSVGAARAIDVSVAVLSGAGRDGSVRNVASASDAR